MLKILFLINVAID